MPPLGRKWEHKINPRSVDIYSDLLRTACLVMTCMFVDPFAKLGDGDTGVALEGALTDGIHLVDYSDILKDVNVCIQARH